MQPTKPNDLQEAASGDADIAIPNPQSQTIDISGTTYKKHITHWYADGNLIILVENVAFRVFQSFLARRGTVMELALAQKQPWNSECVTSERRDTLDVASVVQLDDKAEDFGLLLDVVLPQTCAKAPISAETDWFRLCCLAEIAQKYGMDDVVSQAIILLEQRLPTIERPHRVITGSFTAMTIIIWARKCGFRQFLPMGFYYLSTAGWEIDALNSRTLASLSTRDQLRLQRGRAQLQATVIKLALTRWENCPIGNSKPEKACPDRSFTCWMGYGGKVWPSRDNETRWTNLLLQPLEELRMRADCEVSTLRYLCQSCRKEFVAANRLMISDIIKELGTYFTFEDESSPFGVCPAASSASN
ncbi:hypothetical protein FS837_011154 [Tulasnella sp. UAMH 9824]|nr:hypothetical protein FS837_011154 [Tulasnella sp. UAMH 9824]